MKPLQRANMWMWLAVALAMLGMAVYDVAARGGGKDTFTFVGLAMAAGIMFLAKFAKKDQA